jgi:hypothetical protein
MFHDTIHPVYEPTGQRGVNKIFANHTPVGAGFGLFNLKLTDGIFFNQFLLPGQATVKKQLNMVQCAIVHVNCEGPAETGNVSPAFGTQCE